MVMLGLVSDTHLPRFGRRLPRALLDGLRSAGVEAILHLGDHTAPFVVESLAEIAPVEAVAGNNDPPELVARFGGRRVIVAAGLRIGLVHGHQGPGRTTLDRAFGAFEPGDVDVVAFGHNHVPLCERRDGVLLLNPGSPTDRRRQPVYSYALLEIAAPRTGERGPRPAATGRIVGFAHRSS